MTKPYKPLAFLLLLLMASGSAHAWYDYSWPYRKPITIDASQVNGTHTDFPLLVRIDSDSSIASRAQPDADDIIFTDERAVKLDHEIELYNSTTGQLVAWVRIPTFNSTNGTTIHLYYGNPGASNQQNRTGVWRNSYAAVWHLGEGDTTTEGAYKDSTANGNNGTLLDWDGDTNANQACIGNCIDFTAEADNIHMPPSQSLNNVTHANVTLQAWIRPDSYNRYIMAKRNPGGATNDYGWQWQVYNNGGSIINSTTFVQSWSAQGNTWNGPTGTVTLGTWQFMTLTIDGSNRMNDPIIYRNGTNVTTILNFRASTTPQTDDSSYNFTIGNAIVTNTGYDGLIDEARISTVRRSAQWIQTEYNNQRPGSTFMALGAEEERRLPVLAVHGSGALTISGMNVFTITG